MSQCSPTWVIVVLIVVFLVWLVWSQEQHKKEKFLFDSCAAARPNCTCLSGGPCTCGGNCGCGGCSGHPHPLEGFGVGTTHAHGDLVHTHRGGCMSHSH